MATSSRGRMMVLSLRPQREHCLHERRASDPLVYSQDLDLAKFLRGATYTQHGGRLARAFSMRSGGIIIRRSPVRSRPPLPKKFLAQSAHNAPITKQRRTCE